MSGRDALHARRPEYWRSRPDNCVGVWQFGPIGTRDDSTKFGVDPLRAEEGR